MSFDLIINTVPLLVTLSDVEQCNDTVFDLEALQPSLSINAATETFEYYDSAGNWIDVSNGLDPSNYIFSGSIASNEETITVKVKILQLLEVDALSKQPSLLDSVRVIFLLRFLF